MATAVGTQLYKVHLRRKSINNCYEFRPVTGAKTYHQCELWLQNNRGVYGADNFDRKIVPVGERPGVA